MEIDGKQYAVARRQPNNEQSTLALHSAELAGGYLPAVADKHQW